MATNTRGLDVKSLNTPDETRPFKANGRVEIVNVGGMVVGRGVFEPGWRRSEHVKPIAQTNSCQAAYAAYVVSGRLGVRMDDGTEKEVGPGDIPWGASTLENDRIDSMKKRLSTGLGACS